MKKIILLILWITSLSLIGCFEEDPSTASGQEKEDISYDKQFEEITTEEEYMEDIDEEAQEEEEETEEDPSTSSWYSEPDDKEELEDEEYEEEIEDEEKKDWEGEEIETEAEAGEKELTEWVIIGLWDRYTKDKNHVYYEWEAIKIPWNEDPENLQEWYSEVWTDPRKFEYIDSKYGKDESYIYYKWEPIKDINLAELDEGGLKLIEWGYITDKNNVYRRWKKIEWADPNTFEVVKCYEPRMDCYAKDKNNIYFNSEKIKWANPHSFEFLFSYSYQDHVVYARDKNNIYHNWHKIEIENDDVSLENLEKVPNYDDGIVRRKNIFTGRPYLKDKNNVYYKWEIQEDKDPETFEP